jgi:TolB-like protein/DNA-binding winged helix-turn-helix (wHTH) protein
VKGDFRVGPWLVAPSLNSISCKGTSVHLEPKVMEVLVCLAQHAGETLPKETLFHTVWPDTFVTDDVLKHAISELRRVFEDDAREPRIIETIPKRGYRLVAPVEPLNGAENFPPQAVRSSVGATAPGTGARRFLIWALAIAGAAALSVLIAFNRSRLGEQLWGTSGVPPIHSLAVLPLENLSGDPAQEYFSDGMTDALITDLAQIGSVKVISRTSSMQYKQAQKSLPEIARELNVDGIVEGTVQRSGDRVRITAQLVHGASDKHVWANSYERDIRDVLVLEREVAWDVAQQVQARLAKQNETPSPQPSPLSSKALEAYLQGNYHLNRFGKGAGDDEKREAAEYFQQAIDADPNFAPAYNGLAHAHRGLIWPSSQDANIATKAAERAVALEPSLSDAHKSLGEIKFSAWNWSGSEQEYRRAIALNPNNADAHEWLGMLLDTTGRLDEGWKEQQTAQELDPNNDHLSDALMIRGQYDHAIVIVQMMLKRYPNDGYLHWTLFKDYVQKGMYEEAAPQLEQTWTLYGYPGVSAEVHRAWAASGYRGAVRESAKAMENLFVTKQAFLPGNIAEFYATLGDKDRAFYWLEQAYARHDLEMASTDACLEHLNREFRLDSLRSDPRFKDLMRRVGLPP